MTIQTEVIDDAGRVFVLDELLGEGGQGAVYRAKQPNIALKLLNPPPGVDAADWQVRVQRRIDLLRSLPIDSRDVARPIAALQQPPGYVMEMLSEMEPISRLLARRGVREYSESGGLRRRLRVLTRLAEALSRLHGIPLAYGDLSPNNVFVGASPDDEAVRLIDADNVRLASRPGPNVYTPVYGAPEVVQGRGTTTLSDAFSFAVLAHKLLTTMDPFEGALFESEDAGWDAEPDQDLHLAAQRGELPWIHAEGDRSNKALAGYPPDIVFSNRMRRLFEDAFGPGRLDPSARPTVSAWHEVLRAAADRTLRCLGCGSTYFVANRCPWCPHLPDVPYIRVDAYDWHPEFDTPKDVGFKTSERMVWGVGDLVRVYRHLVAPTPPSAPDPVVLQAEVRGDEVALTLLEEDANWSVIDPVAGSVRALAPHLVVRWPAESAPLFIRTQPTDRPHRLLALVRPERRAP